jgi:hypothetical protein
LIELEFPRAVEPQRAVRCGQDDATAGEVRLHDFAEPHLRRGVERRGRLVKEPDRALDREQAGDRKTSPLASRKIGGRQVGQRIEPDRGKLLLRVGSRRPEKGRPESQVFGDGQRGLQRILVAEIMGLFAKGQFAFAPFQCEAPTGDTDETDHHAKERRFSGAIAAANRQAFPGRDRKAHPRKDVASAAAAGQIRGGKPHQQRPKQKAKAESASSDEADNPAMSGMLSTISCRSGTSLEKTL